MKFIRIKLLLVLIVLSACYINMNAQGSAGTKSFYESRYIVDMPNAGIIPKGTYSCTAVAFHQGGLMAELSVSPFNNFDMGLSFGGSNIIGSGDIQCQNLPGIQIKYRILDETPGIPALCIGISTQGRGIYKSDLKRFETMSPGIYSAVSKNFIWALGTISLHGGINYSFEPSPDKRKVNFYCGAEHSLGSNFSLNIEFNSNFNDGNDKLTNSESLLNAALRWSIASGLTVEMQARDITQNYKNTGGFSRTFVFEFISPI